MQRSYVPVDSTGKEILEYPFPDFPFVCLVSDTGRYIRQEVPWHWHTDVEVFVVTRGSALFNFSEESCVFHEGEGGFITRNTPHSTELYECESNEMITLIFSPAIFCGGKAGSLYQKISSPVYGLRQFQYLKLSPEVAWQQEVMAEIFKAREAYMENSMTSELTVIEHLSRLWQEVIENLPRLYQRMNHTVNIVRQNRLRAMLAFIHSHYEEQITLEDIAGAAGISPRECTRIFREQTGTSPVGYLIEYRITIAASLLKISDMTVTDAAMKTGFNNSSYFTRTFRKVMGMPPKTWQQKNRS